MQFFASRLSSWPVSVGSQPQGEPPWGIVSDDALWPKGGFDGDRSADEDGIFHGFFSPALSFFKKERAQRKTFSPHSARKRRVFCLGSMALR